MGCGFSASIPGLSVPEVDLAALPAVPSLPDYSLALDLGLPAPSGFSLSTPEVDLPALPAPPSLPDYSLAAELGLPVPPGLSLSTPEIDQPSLPAVPSFQLPDCPFDDVAA